MRLDGGDLRALVAPEEGLPRKWSVFRQMCARGGSGARAGVALSRRRPLESGLRCTWSGRSKTALHSAEQGRRSGLRCPVAMSEKLLAPGDPALAVEFAGQVFLCSTSRTAPGETRSPGIQ